MAVATKSGYDEFLAECAHELGRDYTVRRDGLQKEITDLSVLSNARGEYYFGGSGSSTPYEFNKHLKDLAESSPKFKGNRIYSISTAGPIDYVDPRLKDSIQLNAFFVGGNVRLAVHEKYAKYRQTNLGDIPRKFDNKDIPLNAAFVSVAPPRDGYYSLGLNNDVQTSALRNAEKIFVQVNENMPFTLGPGTLLPVESVDYYLYANTDIHSEEQGKPDDLSNLIAENVMNYIEDHRGGLNGRIYQFGIGGVPNAIASKLKDYHNLGVWSEMISDGVMELINNGNINNSTREILTGKTVTSFALGSNNFYNWLDGNENVIFLPTDETNNRSRLESIDGYTSINSALEVDIHGQVGSNSLGSPHHVYSGVGGAEDTMRGARGAKNGASVIALASTAKKGAISKIVPRITGSVAITNHNVDILATEQGVIGVPHHHDLDHVSLAIVNSLAHPRFRDYLMNELDKDLGLCCINKPMIKNNDQEFRKLLRSRKTFDGLEEIIFRSLKPEDLDKLHDGFYAHSDSTIRKRYGNNKPSMSYCESVQRTLVDHSVDGSIGAFANNGSNLVGVGRLYDENGEGEIAIVVDDVYQGKGIGTYMCNQLCNLASAQGKESVYGEVDFGNVEIAHLFKDAGFEKRPSTQVDGWKFSKVIEPKKIFSENGNGKPKSDYFSFNHAHHELEESTRNNSKVNVNGHPNGQHNGHPNGDLNGSPIELDPITQLALAPYILINDATNATVEGINKFSEWRSDLLDHFTAASNTFFRGPRFNKDKERK